LSRIELNQISKAYAAGVLALEAIDLSIAEGLRVVVLGPSGSGKTTILRLIAGLEAPESGTITIGGQDMRDVPPHRRDVAMVFQNPALYPHLNVLENLAFGIDARRFTRGQRRGRVEEVAAILEIAHLLGRRPAELSGGERQRVALGRAVVREPRVLLLDEPFSSLDEPLRASLRDQVISLHRRFGSTLLHVTHDQSEALSLGQRIAVIQKGRLMQYGSPQEIYELPVHRFVASFVGSPGMNLVPCEIISGNSGQSHAPFAEDCGETWVIPTQIMTLRNASLEPPLRLELGFRPESVLLGPGQPDLSSSPGHLRATAVIRRLEYQGSSVLAALNLGGRMILARVEASAAPSAQEGQRVDCFVDMSKASWFDPVSGKRWAPA
jgi:ABC-type sugar transport system ATPase subunit